MKKNENLKNAFSKIGPKMPMGRVPTKIFGVSEFFYRKFVKKKFRDRGPEKSTILGLFSKIGVRNFSQLGKIVFFCVASFFFEIKDPHLTSIFLFLHLHELVRTHSLNMLLRLLALRKKV